MTNSCVTFATFLLITFKKIALPVNNRLLCIWTTMVMTKHCFYGICSSDYRYGKNWLSCCFQNLTLTVQSRSSRSELTSRNGLELTTSPDIPTSARCIFTVHRCEHAWCLLVNPLLLTLLWYYIYDMWLQNTNSRSRGEPFTVSMHLFQDELAHVIFGADQHSVLDYCFVNSLLDPQLSCPTCFADMKLAPRAKLSDEFAWNRKKYLCGSRSYHSVRTSSFFAKTHVPLRKYLHVLYMWAQNSLVQVTAETLGVSRQCVQQHFLFLRQVCSTQFVRIVRMYFETEIWKHWGGSKATWSRRYIISVD